MNLVVGIDFSKGSKNALARALKLPLSRDAVVTLVHVCKTEDPITIKEARSGLGEVKDWAQSEARERTIEAHLLKGVPYEEFLRFTETHKPDLVVLGRHGAWRFKDLMLGTTAERIIRQLRVPVLVTNAPATRNYASMLAAVDLPPESSYRSIEAALSVVHPAPRELHAVHVVDDTYEWAHRHAGWALADIDHQSKGRRAAAEAGLEGWLTSNFSDAGVWQVHIESGEPRDRILHTAKRLGCDLLVLSTHSRTTLGRMVLGSVSEIVLRKAKCDVLIAGPVAPSA